MSALFEDISSKKGTQSFVAYHKITPRFPFEWHYHPEYELTLISKGRGKRIVGDNHENFETGDLVLLGPELPHTWVSDSNTREKQSAVVIQFSEKFIDTFFQYTECAEIRKLLLDARMGIHFQTIKNESITEKIKQLPDIEGVGKITELLNILNCLTQKKYKVLASPFFQGLKGKTDERRINTVCRYVQNYADDKISITKAASLVNLSVSAFCKFFKRSLGTTFSDYVNTIRIGRACHLLVESDKTIAEIAFASGFESLSYFNRIFFKKKGVQPRIFRINL